jgi:hypothetical protein
MESYSQFGQGGGFFRVFEKSVEVAAPNGLI